MSDAPNTWDVDEAIQIDLFVAHPVTNLGLTGQVGFITLSISRASDGKYWTGAAWAIGFTTVLISEVDAANRPGLYRYVLSALANSQPDVYTAFATVNNPGVPISGQNSEVHRSRSAADVRIYEAEPA